MMYFIPGAATHHKFPPYFGAIVTPSNKDSGSALARIRAGWRWICDNGVFSGKFDEHRFFTFLEKMKRHRRSCLFVVVPDVLHRIDERTVVGDAAATLAQFPAYAERIRALGYKVAFVAQDGQEDLPLPHPTQFEALFIGGSTKWKLGPGAVQCIKRAQQLEKWVHAGRVNSRRRMRHFSLLGVNSVDGTKITFAPDQHRKDLIRWMDQTRHPLFRL